MSFNNRVAFVTGGVKGNGKGIVEVLASQGVKISLVSRGPEVSDVVAELKGKGYEVIGFRLDVRDKEAVKAAVEETIATYGKIDILVNNAGIMECMPFLETSDEIMNAQMDINVKGAWYATQCVLPYMVQAGYGRIITLSSVTGDYVTDGGDTAYAMSKAALIGFGKSLAVEFAGNGITSNMICPGCILTPMIEKYAREQEPEDPAHFISLLEAGVPVGRLGTPEDVGHLAAYLASDEASFITGASIVLDGGGIIPESKAL